jgi:hypothetical protein
MAYSSTAPGPWFALSDDERELSRLDGELCVIETSDGRRYFVRANVAIPVIDGPDPLVFSAWVELDGIDMGRLIDRWEHPDRADDPAYLGVLANDLPGYVETLGLAAEVQTGPAGDRSRAVLLPSGHPLADEQWEGVTPDRVRAIAEVLAHPSPLPPR